MSFNTPYNHYLTNNSTTLNTTKKQKKQLFFSKQTQYNKYHSKPLLSITFPTQNKQPNLNNMFHNTNLYNMNNNTTSYFDNSLNYYPKPNININEFSQNTTNNKKHQIPNLKNIALTTPYIHNNNIKTLSEIIAHYTQNKHTIEKNPYQNNNNQNPNKNALITKFKLTTLKTTNLITFLHYLTNKLFITNPHFSNPHELP